MIFVTYSLLALAASPAPADREVHSDVSAKKLCRLNGVDSSRAILAFNKIDAKDIDAVIQDSTARHPSYRRNLIAAGVKWDSKLKDLNETLKSNRACIARTDTNSFVMFQIPDPKSFDNYEKVLAAFEKKQLS